jgi:hypothetical protein
MRGMTTITFDTHKFVKDLETAGIPSVQAEAFVRAQQEILSQALDSTLSTKADLYRLDNSTKEGFAAVKLDIAHMDGKVDKLQWMVGILIAIAAANFAKQFF